MQNDDFNALCEMEFTEAKTQKTVVVRLGPPTYDEIRDCYVCLTEIVGLEGGQTLHVHGEDAFQATSMSLERFRILFARQRGSDFRSPDGNSPHMLFPKTVPWVYGLDVYERLCKIIDEEVQTIEDERTRRWQSRGGTDEK